MLIKDLFEKSNVECPEWLSDNLLDDEWENCIYSFENNIHKWNLKNSLHHLLITFDGETYTFGAFFDGSFQIIEKITEAYVIQV